MLGYIFTIICFFQLLNADISQMTTELQQKNIESQKIIDPLIQEAANLERQKAELEFKRKQIESQEQEIKVKKEKIQNEITTYTSSEELSEILIGKFGHCQVTQGSMKNEYYINYNDKFEKFAIRMVFATIDSSQRPVARIYRQNGLEYFEVEQREYVPAQAAKKENFHSATIRFDQQKKIVHAVFKGEMISDKGLFGFFGSSFISRGVTCLTLDATDSI